MKKIKYLLSMPVMALSILPIVSCGDGSVKSIEAKLTKTIVAGDTITREDIEVSTVYSNGTKKVITDWTSSISLPLKVISMDTLSIDVEYQNFWTVATVKPTLPVNCVKVTFSAGDHGKLSGYLSTYVPKGKTLLDASCYPDVEPDKDYSYEKLTDKNDKTHVITAATTLEVDTEIVVNFAKYTPSTSDKGLTITPCWSEGKIIGLTIRVDKTKIDELEVDADGTYTVPEELTYKGNKHAVLKIGEGAFKEVTKVKKIKIPTCITTIGANAFEQNTNTAPESIKSVEFVNINNSHLTSIGAYAFKNCQQLEGITLPDSVDTIDECAFDMSEISNVKFAQINFNATSAKAATLSIKKHAFNNCKQLKSFTIPDNTIEIGGFDNTGLTSNELIIPKTVQIIAESCFENVTNVTKFTLQDGIALKRIYDKAFANSSIDAIALPNTMLSIGENAFANSKLATITFASKDKTVDKNILSMGDGSFSGTKLSTITIPNYVTQLGNQQFYNCQNLSQVLYEDDCILESIGASGIGQTFGNCPNLKSFTVPASVRNFACQTFGEYASKTLNSLEFKADHVWYWGESKKATYTPSTTEFVLNAENFTRGNDVAMLNYYLHTTTFKMHPDTPNLGYYNDNSRDVEPGTLFGNIDKPQPILYQPDLYEVKYYQIKTEAGYETIDDSYEIKEDVTIYAFIGIKQ